jgi:hypothetical protein
MKTLWNDPALRLRFGTAARARAYSHFHADQMVESYCDLYRTMLRYPAKPQQSHRLAVPDVQQVRHG